MVLSVGERGERWIEDATGVNVLEFAQVFGGGFINSVTLFLDEKFFNPRSSSPSTCCCGRGPWTRIISNELRGEWLGHLRKEYIAASFLEVIWPLEYRSNHLSTTHSEQRTKILRPRTLHPGRAHATKPVPQQRKATTSW